MYTHSRVGDARGINLMHIARVKLDWQHWGARDRALGAECVGYKHCTLQPARERTFGE